MCYFGAYSWNCSFVDANVLFFCRLCNRLGDEEKESRGNFALTKKCQCLCSCCSQAVLASGELKSKSCDFFSSGIFAIFNLGFGVLILIIDRVDQNSASYNDSGTAITTIVSDHVQVDSVARLHVHILPGHRSNDLEPCSSAPRHQHCSGHPHYFLRRWRPMSPASLHRRHK